MRHERRSSKQGRPNRHRTIVWIACCFAVGLGSTTSAEPSPPTSNPTGPFNFSLFETVVLPRWLKAFTLDFEAGAFSYYNKSAQPTPSSALYGTVDVIHVLASVGRLAHFSDTKRDAWASTIHSFQIPDSGFYKVGPHAPGHQPYHGAGEATAALALLSRQPRYNNTVYMALAQASPTEWAAFFEPLYNGSVCYSKSLGGNNIHSCGQIIGSVPAVLAYTTGNTFSSFFTWWSSWVANRTTKTLGVLCPVSNSTHALYECLGGGMATHGIQLGLGLGLKLSDPQALLEFALRMQDDDGLWDSDPASMSLDGIFQVTRSSLQLGRARWGEVKTSCTKLLATQEKLLNSVDRVMKTLGNTTHDIANVVANVAECAQQFPDLVFTLRPWRCCARYV